MHILKCAMNRNAELSVHCPNHKRWHKLCQHGDKIPEAALFHFGGHRTCMDTNMIAVTCHISKHLSTDLAREVFRTWKNYPYSPFKKYLRKMVERGPKTTLRQQSDFFFQCHVGSAHSHKVYHYSGPVSRSYGLLSNCEARKTNAATCALS